MCMSLFFCNVVPDFVNNGKMFGNMKKILVLFAAVLTAYTMKAADKMTFVIEGPEDTYNQIRIVNETSIDAFTCRVVTLKGNDEVASVYGIYSLKSRLDEDSNTNRIDRATKLGVQMMKDFEGELSFDVEYKDRPFFDYIVIHLRDKVSGFEDKL